MFKNRNIFYVPVIMVFLLAGCAMPVVKTRLDAYLEKNFEGFEVPETINIKAKGKSRDFPYVSFDQVWDSTLLVLMQKGIIARNSKNNGVIVTVPTLSSHPPFALFVEKGDIVRVYMMEMPGLLNLSDKPALVEEPKTITVAVPRGETIKIEKDKIQELIREERIKLLFDRLSTQVYSGTKWKYLYSDTLKK